MKLQIASDLHYEFLVDYKHTFADNWEVTADVLVLAGDIVSPLVPRWALKRFCARWPHVVYVLGNHEYYHKTKQPSWPDCDNLHVLNPGSVVIEGQRFIGATLWFPELPFESNYRPFLSDFHFLSADKIHAMHERDLGFLKARLEPGSIVVTHHMPHPQSIAPQFIGNALNRFFLAEDAQSLVTRGGAKLWIHGHTHIPCDYQINDTRVVCNPRGYPHESAPNYLPLEIEL